MLAGLLYRSHRMLQVARIVHRVEDPEDVHTVLGRLADEPIDDLVVVVPVAEQVLPTQQHLQPGVGHQLAEGAQPLPRVFVKETDTAVVGGPAPAFDRPETSRIDVCASIHHVFHGHAGRHQALMGVPQHQLGDTHLAGFGNLNVSRTHGTD